MKIYKFFASAPRETEEYLANEIQNFNPQGVKKSHGGVLFKGDKSLAVDVLLHSRVASRVYRHIAEFKVQDTKEIYTNAVTHKWTDEFSSGQTFKIKTLFDKDSLVKFKNSIYMSQLLKDAVVDQFKNASEERPNVDLQDSDIDILMRIERISKLDYKVQLWIDLTGVPLDRRGYRKAGHTAPLRENLAAAIILATKWNHQKQTLLDPMCGSGTLLIEAALIKYDIAPTFLRVRDAIEQDQQVFALERQFWFSEDEQLCKYFDKQLQRVYNNTLEIINTPTEIQIFGSEIEKKSLRMAGDTIKRCHLDKHIYVTIHNAKSVVPPSEKPGIVVCNPPYGERLSELEKLKPFYHDFAENLKANFKNSSVFIFTGSPELRKSMSLQTSQRIPFFNGKIECRLLRYDLY